MSFTHGVGSEQTSVVRPLPGPQRCPSLGGHQLLKNSIQSERCLVANLPLSCSVPKYIFLKAYRLLFELHLEIKRLAVKAFYCSPRLLRFPHWERNEGLVTCASP